MKARFIHIKTTTLYSDEDNEKSNSRQRWSDGPARCALAPAGGNLYSSSSTDSTLRSTPRARPARSTSMPTKLTPRVNFEHITERSPENSLYLTARDESLPYQDARNFFSAEFSDVGHNQTQIELRRGMTKSASIPAASAGKLPTTTPKVDLLRLCTDGQSDLEIHIPPVTDETIPSATKVHMHYDKDGRSHVNIGNMDEINDTLKSFSSLDSDRPFSSKNMPKAVSSAVKENPGTWDKPVIIITPPTPETSLEAPDSEDVDESWRTPRRVVNNATYTVSSVNVPGEPSNVNVSGVGGLDSSGNIRPPAVSFNISDPTRTPRRPPPRNALRSHSSRYQEAGRNYSNASVNARRRLSFINDPDSSSSLHDLPELNEENIQKPLVLGVTFNISDPTRTPRRPPPRNAMRSYPEVDHNFSNTSVSARRRLSFAMDQNSSSGMQDLDRLNEENEENAQQQQPAVNYYGEGMQFHIPILPHASVEPQNVSSRTPSPAPRRAVPKKKKQQKRASRQDLFELDEAILTTRQRIQRRARLQREELQKEMDARAQQALQRRRPSQNQRSASSPPFNYEGLFNWS